MKIQEKYQNETNDIKKKISESYKNTTLNRKDEHTYLDGHKDFNKRETLRQRKRVSDLGPTMEKTPLVSLKLFKGPLKTLAIPFIVDLHNEIQYQEE